MLLNPKYLDTILTEILQPLLNLGWVTRILVVALG